MDKSYYYGRFACAAMVAALVMVTSGAAIAQTTYGVFCANGRIEIDSRSEEEMRRQRGACQFGRFPFRMDAESFARKNFKTIGAPLQLPLARLSVAVSAA